MKPLYALFAAALALAGIPGAAAQEALLRALARHDILAVDLARTHAEHARFAPKATPSCIPDNPLPTVPGSGAQSTTATVNVFGEEEFVATWWRQSCHDDGTTYMYLRVVPTLGKPFICSSAFKLLQGEQVFDVKLVVSYNGLSVCEDKGTPLTMLVTTWSFDPPFDPLAASQLTYFTNRTVPFASLPTFAPPGAPITPAIGLWWNPAESGSGYNFDVKHGVLVVTVYSYKANGDSEWYIASGPLTNNGRNFTGSLDKIRNGQCISCAYKAPVVGGSDGPISIVFSSSTAAVMTLPGGRVINIEPQAF